MAVTALTTPSTAMVGRNFIDGSWLQVDQPVFESLNPSRIEDVVGVFPRTDAAGVSDAVEAARRAFPHWRRTSRISRGEHFDRLAQLIKRDLDSLAKLVTRESGKQINEARADVIEGLHMVQYVFSTARMPHGEVVASEVADKESFVLRRRKGLGGAIRPRTLPFAIPLRLLGPSMLERS